MLSVAVQQKPTIEQLGGSFTPGPKILRRQSSNAGESVSAYIGSMSKKKPGRRASGTAVRASTKRLHLTPPGSFKPSNALSGSVLTEPDAKRRKMDPLPDPVYSREKLSVPCKENDAVATPLSAKPGAGPRRPRLASSTNTSTSKMKTPASQSRRKKVPSVERGAVQPDDPKPRFHSVRGTDGRFVTLPFPPPSPSASNAPPPSKPTVQIPETATPDKATSGLLKLLTIDSPINRAELVKQKVKSYPRSRVHYYNRVVKSKISQVSSSSNPTYYFVLNYDEAASTLCLVPMAPRGTLSGKFEGRPRYQAVLDGTAANLLRNEVATDYQVVPAKMIMKTPVVANEAWDVQDE
jgi:hypothetical protein